MVRAPVLALIFWTALAAPLFAQTQAPDTTAPDDTTPPETVTEPAAPAPPRTMPGTWEFSNADREKTCSVTFRNDAAKVGKRLDFDPACAKLFPFIPEIAGWRLNDNDFLRLLDARGIAVLEFSEVE